MRLSFNTSLSSPLTFFLHTLVASIPVAFVVVVVVDDVVVDDVDDVVVDDKKRKASPTSQGKRRDL